MTTFFKTFLIFVLVIIVAALIGLLALYAQVPAHYNVLVIGSDQRADERARSDVLMVFSIPKDAAKEPVILTIPRDTRVEVPGHGTQKITHAYALGERRGDLLGNPDLTHDTVEDFLDIKINATCEITFDGFKEIVDKVGGVDTSEGHLQAEEALLLVRNRFREGGDFARTADQREIFQDLIKRIKEQNLYSWIYNYALQGQEMRLDYSLPQATMFFGFLYLKEGGFPDFSEVEEEVIPGYGDSIYTPEFGQSLYYWVPDLPATKELVNSKLK